MLSLSSIIKSKVFSLLIDVGLRYICIRIFGRKVVVLETLADCVITSIVSVVHLSFDSIVAETRVIRVEIGRGSGSCWINLAIIKEANSPWMASRHIAAEFEILKHCYQYMRGN
jgi:hypothetical protein